MDYGSVTRRKIIFQYLANTYKSPNWQKFANLRLLYTYMFTHPGAKLLFMGNEFAATKEWNYTTELQWDLLTIQSHAGMKLCVQSLNELYTCSLTIFLLLLSKK